MDIDNEAILKRVGNARKRDKRPCIEAVPTYKGWYLGFESGRKNGKASTKRTMKFKLPGGGIEQGQTPSVALAAEFLEEIGVTVDIGIESGAWGTRPYFPVLAIGEMSTSRPEWGGKLRIITTLELPHTNFVLNGEIVQPTRFCRVQDLFDQVGCCVYTSPEAARLYRKAIRALETDLGYLT